MKLDEIKIIGVVGGGVMGGGIAQTAILAGYTVIVRDLNYEILARMKGVIVDGRFGLKKGLALGKHTESQVQNALNNLSVTTNLEDLKQADFIIEAIGGSNPQEIENKGIKLKLFQEIDMIIKKESIFASNTSRITIADLATVTKRKDKFLGMHWFSPANIMKAVEVIWTQDVTEENIKLVEDLCDKFGKIHVRVKDVPGDTGFVSNRIFGTARQEAQRIVDAGICTPEGINTIMMNGFNWPYGPTGVSGVRTGWQ